MVPVEVIETVDEDAFVEDWAAAAPTAASTAEPTEAEPTEEPADVEGAMELVEDADEEDADNSNEGFIGGLFSRFAGKKDARKVEAKEDAQGDAIELAEAVDELPPLPEVREPEPEPLPEPYAIEPVVESEPEPERIAEPEPEPVVQVDVAPPKSQEHEDTERRRLLEAPQAQQQQIEEPPPPKPEIVYVGGYYKRSNPWAKGPRVKVVD